MGKLEKLLSLGGAMLAMSDAYSQKFSGKSDNVFMQDAPDDNIPKHSEKALLLSREHKALTEFSIHGHKIMAYSRKDAITRLKNQGLITKKKKNKKNNK